MGYSSHMVIVPKRGKKNQIKWIQNVTEFFHIICCLRLTQMYLNDIQKQA